MRVEIKAVNAKHILRRHFQPDPGRCLKALELLLSAMNEKGTKAEIPNGPCKLAPGASEAMGAAGSFQETSQ